MPRIQFAFACAWRINDVGSGSMLSKKGFDSLVVLLDAAF
jgi:hypothetical protein